MYKPQLIEINEVEVLGQMTWLCEYLGFNDQLKIK